MLGSSFLLLAFASSLGLSQVVPSCPPSDTPPCTGLRTADFDDIPATTGLLTSPSTCLASYEALSYDGFSVFSLALAGGASQHFAGFQLNRAAHRIDKINWGGVFMPRSFEFLCALPTLGVNLAASTSCTVRVTPIGPNVEGQPKNCSYTTGGLLSPLVPASCELPDWGFGVNAISIEVVQPAVLNTVYAFGMSNFSYVDACWD
ncbi:hypothetical protein PFICI_06695 [Pestalotiopsis fici W106-1]|uniref:Ubiquitin 3 binding protein But2 C-terminal domain-containing protein n=1 Tax=Pestalotiopsis fici (strain W106-1 / CGMCC3.15140) TaxID=1229662 RepID=W3X6F0_PESFW|nr:uncharacterized protein PFICI_06695 [Pestalotiopsis fici W106-1]ETS81693.1 hypothetical protein PFICI_06695 [Pestalotiopsis fici W106-1]